MTKNAPALAEIVSRRQTLRIGAATAMCVVGVSAAVSQQTSPPREIVITDPNGCPSISIAIPDFVAADSKLGAEFTAVVSADLERSGLFKLLAPAGFPESLSGVSHKPQIPNWKAAGVEALVSGQLGVGPNGQIQAEFRLWDTILSTDKGGQRIPLQNWRRLAHIVADHIYEKLTPEKGYFDTQIVFIDENGPKERRVKRLAIMDQDGANVRTLTQGKEIVLTPRFNPVGQEIAYLTFAGDQPQRVMIMNTATGQREQVGSFPGATFAPRFSPDGQRLVLSFTPNDSANTQLLEYDLRSKQARQLTPSQSIDTGPCYAPNGREIVFESDREGTQQLYIMGFDGSNVRRLSRGDGRYSTPVWSPRGDYIAFTKQASGSFLIGVMKPDGTGERILSTGYHNEGPTWAPNGRVLMFFRESQGANGGPHLFTVDVRCANERPVKTLSFASDPAWSPLLS